METLLKPRSVGLNRLTNGKYSAFMNRVVDLTGDLKSEDLVFAADIPVFKAKVAEMTDIYNHSRSYAETPELHSYHSVRVNAFRRLATVLGSFKYATAEAEKAAYNSLSVVFAPYAGMPKLPIEEVSASILGLVMDFAKADNAASVTALKLTEYVTALDTANKAFIAKYGDRQASKRANEQNKAAIVRPELDSLYDILVNKIFATNLLAPNGEVSAFLSSLNSYIDEMIVNMNVSAGLRAAAKKRKAEKDKTDGKTDGGTTGGTTDTGSGSTTDGKADEGTTGGGSTDSGTTTGGSSGGTGKEDLPVGDA